MKVINTTATTTFTAAAAAAIDVTMFRIWPATNVYIHNEILRVSAIPVAIFRNRINVIRHVFKEFLLCENKVLHRHGFM